MNYKEKVIALLNSQELSNEQKEKLKYVFPELAESDDERIRKEMIEILKNEAHEFPESVIAHKSNSWIAWLEKQGKSIDKIVERARTEKQRVLVTESDGVANIDWDTRSLQDAEFLMKYGLNYIKKKLEKQGEQKPVIDIDIPFGAKDSELQEVTYYIPKGFHAEIEGNNVVIKKGEQKPTWSEEDEEILNLIIARLHSHPNVEAEEYGKDYHWLKSLKDKVQPQPKQEWGEEDEQMMNSFLYKVEVCNLLTNKENVWIINKLKSLKPQNIWKPSDEQMKVLNEVINFAADHGTMRWNDYIYNVLKGLREQLKKLKR